MSYYDPQTCPHCLAEYTPTSGNQRQCRACRRKNLDNTRRCEVAGCSHEFRPPVMDETRCRYHRRVDGRLPWERVTASPREQIVRPARIDP